MGASVQLLEETSLPDAVELRSRGLELVLSRIEFARRHESQDFAASSPGRATLLELGAALAANVAALNAFRCRLYVADAYRGLRDLALDDAVAEAASVLPLPEDARLHAIFAWDILSFLDPLVVTALVAAVGRHCNDGALLHAIAYTGERIPAEPASVRMAGDAKIAYHSSTPPVRDNPRYSPVALERMLPGFNLRHSFLLPSGLQDFVFAYEQGA